MGFLFGVCVEWRSPSLSAIVASAADVFVVKDRCGGRGAVVEDGHPVRSREENVSPSSDRKPPRSTALVSLPPRRAHFRSACSAVKIPMRAIALLGNGFVVLMRSHSTAVIGPMLRAHC